MTAEEYFKEFWKYIDKRELKELLLKLSSLYKTKSICPSYNNIFKAFNLCPYDRLKVVIIGQDPYPQKGIATGLAFANNNNVKNISPSLSVLKEAIVNFELPHNFIIFANDLEEWEKQGVLLLNSALTVEENKIGSHANLWRPFIGSFLRKLSSENPGLIYVLLGKQAQSFKCYIREGSYILEEKHPSYYARTNTKMPYTLFKEINRLVLWNWRCKIDWYHELKNNDYEEVHS